MAGSLQLGLLNRLLRSTARPRLAGTPDPLQARREFEAFGRLALGGAVALSGGLTVGPPDIHWSRPPQPGAPLILFFHGGAYFAGSPGTHAGLARRLERATGLPVGLPDYRLAPEHPAPAAFEDGQAAFDALMDAGHAPEQIVLGGDSAGGGIALALLADLCRCGRRPAAAFVFSPWTDLSLSGESLRTNRDADPLLPAGRVEDAAGHVLGGFDPRDPRISPLFARYEAPPPVQIHVGTTEILLDDSRRMADVLARDGGDVELHEMPEAPHAWPLFGGHLPETRTTLRSVAAFVAEATNCARTTGGS